MANTERERSDYEIVLSVSQLEALLEIAARKDRPFEEVVLGAIDRYIAAEKKLWPKKN